MKLSEDCFNKAFTHVYIERAVADTEAVKSILEKLPQAHKIIIGHYKDVFCRKGQDVAVQTAHQSLILAKKQGQLIYPGARVCQSFGNSHFYYTSCIMNCIYDCEYCYLKGMYPSGNIVLFINIEDIFTQLEEILAQHDAYVCVSYDTDLAALEQVCGYVSRWCSFAAKHDNLHIEIRTKSASLKIWDQLKKSSQVIFAFTLSPDEVIQSCEHRTPSLDMRLKAAKAAMDRGFKVRLCFDPAIYCRNWKQYYGEMLDRVSACINMKQVLDVSVGSFRISQDYLKKMRKNYRESAIVQFPYENTNGVYHYPEYIMNEMEEFIADNLKTQIGKEKIFRWQTT